MTDALGAQIQRAPNRFRRAILARVRGQPHAVISGPGVAIAKHLWRSFLLVAADAHAHNSTIVVTNRQLKNLLRCFGTELSYGIKKPQQGNAEVPLAAQATAFQAVENGRKILLAPQADSHGDVNLGMQNALFLQPLHQAVGDQFVIFRSTKVLGDVLEGEEKSGKVLVAVKRINLRRSYGFATTPAQFEQCGRLNRALEMQVQLCLGQKSQKTARRLGNGGHDFQIVVSSRTFCMADGGFSGSSLVTSCIGLINNRLIPELITLVASSLPTICTFPIAILPGVLLASTGESRPAGLVMAGNRYLNQC